VLPLLRHLTPHGADGLALQSFPEACLAILRVIIQDSLSHADRTLVDVDAVLGATAVIGHLLTFDGVLLDRRPFSRPPLAQRCDFSVWARLEVELPRFSKGLSAKEFAHALESLQRAVLEGRIMDKRLFLIFLSSILVRNSPNGKVLSLESSSEPC
jgi:hypothetical protein